MTPIVQTSLRTIYQGASEEVLPSIPDKSIQCCVTSPSYWGLRDYKHNKQLGHEKTPEEYVSKLVAIMREVRRVLATDGTLWINLGDSYAGSGKGAWDNKNGGQKEVYIPDADSPQCKIPKTPSGLKSKDLVGIPWMVAFALRADGWYLRCDIIWSKPNPMPESVIDRPTKAHEYLFLLSKSSKYFYDREAIKDQPSPALIRQIEEGYNGQALKDYLGASVQDASATKGRIIEGYRKRIDKQRGHGRRHAGFNDKWDALTPTEQALCGRNKRSVWTVAPANYREAHFATFPPKLIEPCILAASRIGDTVLDPFAGSGTTGEVAITNGRKALLIELNPDYVQLAIKRTDIPYQTQLTHSTPLR